MEKKKLIKGITAVILSALMSVSVLASLSSCGNSEANTTAAESEKVGVKLDVAKLDEIEAKNTCLVKISGKEIITDTNNFSINGSDSLALTINNDSDSAISSVSVYVVGYDSNGNAVKVQNGVVSISSAQYVQAFTFAGEEGNKVSIAAGESEQIGINCDSESFENVRAIVSEYITDDGSTVQNDIAEEWLKVASTQVTSLD